MKKHILLAVAVVLLCVLMAGVVSATDMTYHEAYTVTDLTTNLSAGNNVRLMNDLTFIFSNGVNQSTIPNGKDVILDLNGRTISTTQNTADSPALITIGKSKTESGSLTVTGNGKITATRADPTNLNQWTYLFFVKSGTLTIENGEYYSYGPVVGTNGHSDNDKGSKDAKIIINGGTYKSPDDTVFYLPGENTSLIMNNGEIIGDKGGVEIRSGSVTLNGGSITANGEEPEDLQAESGVTSNTGAAIALTWMENYQEPTKVTINGGTINSKNGTAILNFVQSGSSNDMYSVSISGGTIEGKKAIFKKYGEENKDITPSITGGTFIVHTFADLKACLEAGANVKLGEDITGTYTDDSDRVYIDKVTSTLDLNGKTLTVTRSSGDGNKGFIKINGTEATIGSLTVTDSTGNGEIILNKGSSEGATLFFVSNYGKIIIDNKDITLTAPQSVIGGNGDGTHTPPTIDIKGGTLTSTEGAAIFLSAENTKMTMIGGSVTGKSGLEIVSGTYTISGGTITGNGDHLEEVAEPDQGSLEDGSGIVLRTTTSYDGNIALTISGTAKIASEKGVAIRNYVRDTDLTGSKTFSVEIKDSAKIEGKVAAIANQKYNGESPAFTAPTFTLSGGNYLAPSYETLLVGEPNVLYADNYAMSDTPVKDGYYAPIEIKKQTSSASTNDEGRTVTIDSEATTTVESTTATITTTGDAKVNLILTYPEGAAVSSSSTGVTSDKPLDTVTAEYKSVDVPATSGTAATTFLLAVTAEGTDLLDSDNLPTISTEINEDAKTKLQGTATLISMVTVDITKIKSKNPELTLTFKVPRSWFTGKDLSAVRAYHFDGTNLVDKGTPQRTEDGTDYVFTITASEASPWLLGLRAATPTPTYQPISSSGDGNMDGALRVLFETSGGSFISPATGLSYGDKLTAPANPVKDGYTFAGWYKDSACTQSWSFSDGISGDMTLYAKWTGGSSSSQSSSSQQSGTTTQSTAKATPASTQAQSGTTATTAAPVSTTAAGVTPTLTQAPAPVAGLLFGLLIAGVFLRRRE